MIFKVIVLEVQHGLWLQISTNGVAQGGILSPRFFIVYIDDLSIALSNLNMAAPLEDVQSIICFMRMTWQFSVRLQMRWKNF